MGWGVCQGLEDWAELSGSFVFRLVHSGIFPDELFSITISSPFGRLPEGILAQGFFC